MLARRQAEESGELPPVGERSDLDPRRGERGGGDRSNAGYCHQPLRPIVGLGDSFKLGVDGGDLLVERFDLIGERRQRHANLVANDDLASIPTAAGAWR
jgi:hypothetical protein